MICFFCFVGTIGSALLVVVIFFVGGKFGINGISNIDERSNVNLFFLLVSVAGTLITFGTIILLGYLGVGIVFFLIAGFVSLVGCCLLPVLFFFMK